jgi:hypothetical protein
MKQKKAGRPSDYKPEYAQELIDYFSIPPYVETTKTVVSNGQQFEVPEPQANDTPTFAGFASQIGSHRESLLNWTKEHPEFFDAYKRAKELQENFIVVNGTKGLINTAFGIFVAKNVCGYRDRQPDEAVNVNITLEDLVSGSREEK